MDTQAREIEGSLTWLNLFLITSLSLALVMLAVNASEASSTFRHLKLDWIYPDCTEAYDVLLDGSVSQAFREHLRETIVISEEELQLFDGDFYWQLLSCEDHIIFVGEGVLGPKGHAPPFSLIYNKEDFVQAKFSNYLFVFHMRHP